MITQAAIWASDGVVYTGLRHDLIINEVAPPGVCKVHPKWQGFVDTEGNFLHREEAAKVALETGQLERLTVHRKDLFSEEFRGQWWPIPKDSAPFFVDGF